MQTIILLIILFLLSIFSVLLYYKVKNSKLSKLQSGICPVCGAKPKEFYDETNNTTFKIDVIKARLLKNHGCSGASDIEYRCTQCDMREVHSQANEGCGI
jgi:protein-arginine kinase activator protein McsA